MEFYNLHFAMLDPHRAENYGRMGLLDGADASRPELHGYEVALNGQIEIPVVAAAYGELIRTRLRRICIEQSSQAIERVLHGRRTTRRVYATVL